jgi:restriction system protein
MARAGKSALADLVKVTAKLPWWIGVVLAIVFYVGLHAVASSIQIRPATDMHAFADAAAKQLIKTFTVAFQYILPTAFLIASILSVLATRRRQRVYANVATNNEQLHKLSWRDFELLVSEFFRRRGFSVKEVGGGGPDGGVDLIISSGTDRYVVQCKKWKARKVDVTTVRELYGVMAAMSAAGAFVVTSGTFTDEARRFAEGKEIELIASEYLLSEIGKDQIIQRTAETLNTRHSAPACPQCGASMTMRTTRNGHKAGTTFWGCSTFPKCRGIRQTTANV